MSEIGNKEEESKSKIFHRKGFDIQRLKEDKNKLKVSSTAGDFIVTPKFLGTLFSYYNNYSDYDTEDPVFEEIIMDDRYYKLQQALIQFIFHEHGMIEEIEIPENLILYRLYFITHFILPRIVYTSTRRILDGTAHQRMVNGFIKLKEYVEKVIPEYDDYELSELLYDLQVIELRESSIDENDDNSSSTYTADENKCIYSYYSDAVKSIKEIAELIKEARDSFK